MRIRCAVIFSASAALVLAGCGGGEDIATGTPTPDAAIETQVESKATHAEEMPVEPAPEPTVAEDYMNGDGPKDVTSHMACINWTDPATETGPMEDREASIASRALRSDDSDMNAVAMEAGTGPMITDPWSLTQLCLQHGYTIVEGSLAEDYYVESVMGSDS